MAFPTQPPESSHAQEAGRKLKHTRKDSPLLWSFLYLMGMQITQPMISILSVLVAQMLFPWLLTWAATLQA